MANKYTAAEVVDLLGDLDDCSSFPSSSNSEIDEESHIESAVEATGAGTLERIRYLSFSEDDGSISSESSVDSDTEESVGEACREEKELECFGEGLTASCSSSDDGREDFGDGSSMECNENDGFGLSGSATSSLEDGDATDTICRDKREHRARRGRGRQGRWRHATGSVRPCQRQKQRGACSE